MVWKVAVRRLLTTRPSSPVRCVRSALAIRLGWYCWAAAAASTRARVLGSTDGWPESARLAVLVLTPAAAATEVRVARTGPVYSAAPGPKPDAPVRVSPGRGPRRAGT